MFMFALDDAGLPINTAPIYLKQSASSIWERFWVRVNKNLSYYTFFSIGVQKENKILPLYLNIYGGILESSLTLKHGVYL